MVIKNYGNPGDVICPSAWRLLRMFQRGRMAPGFSGRENSMGRGSGDFLSKNRCSQKRQGQRTFAEGFVSNVVLIFPVHWRFPKYVPKSNSPTRCFEEKKKNLWCRYCDGCYVSSLSTRLGFQNTHQLSEDPVRSHTKDTDYCHSTQGLPKLFDNRKLVFT